MFGRLLPKEGRFFDLFNALALVKVKATGVTRGESPPASGVVCAAAYVGSRRRISAEKASLRSATTNRH